MTHATEPDLGPLTWVKGEIDAALARATETLGQAAGADDAAAALQFAQTHLHQVRGAISIIGLDGLSQFTESAEQLLGALARGEPAADADSIALAGRAVAAIGNYLDELVHGAPDQPLRLAPLYSEIANVRGLQGASAADLFYPDLSPRPPRRPEGTTTLTGDAAQAELRGARTRFERGLVEWLRTGAGGAGAQAMRDAIATVEALQATPPARALWWASLAFFDALIADSLTPDPGVKRLCAQINAQFGRLMNGATSAPERLLREILYRVATTPDTTDHQRAVRACWQLDSLLPAAGAGVSDIPLAPVLGKLHAQLAALREHWDEFCNGTAVALARFDERLEAVAPAAAALGRPAVDRLVAGLIELSRWLRRDPLQFSDAVALEVATALLRLDAILDRSVPDAGLAGQVDTTLARLAALRHGEILPAGDEASATDEMRRAQEKDALAQLAKEMLASLAQVEQSLDDYFRDQGKRAPLALLQQPLQQIIGALGILGETDALGLVSNAAERIAELARGEEAPDPAAFEALAHELSALGFYLEALPRGDADLKRFLDSRREYEAVTAAPEAAAEAPHVPFGEPAAIVEPSQPEHQHGQPAAADSEEIQLFEAPIDFSLEDEDATGGEATGVDAATDSLPVLTASEEQIDAELLCIFIEEANEVLAAVGAQLEHARQDPQDLDRLTPIRRGFHTLKGSGRMVGLRELGEAAWGLEQTLNRWLQLDWPTTPALLHLIESARGLFADWVAQLESGGAHGRDASALLAEAERLRSADEPVFEPGAIAPPAAAPGHADSAQDELLPSIPTPDAPATVEVQTQAPQRFTIEAADFVIDDELAPETDVLEQPPAPEAEAMAELAGPIADSGAAAESGEAAETAEATETAAATPDDMVLIGDTELSRALFELYQAEATEYLGTLHHEFDRLAANASLVPPENALRAAHTLAGISGTARLEPLHELGRALELAIERLHELPQPPTREELELFQATIAALQAMLVEVAAERMPQPAPALVAALGQSGRTPHVEAAPAGAGDATAELPAAAAVQRAEEAVPRPADGGPSPTPVAPALAGVVPPPQDDIDAQLLPIFFEEGRELLAGLHATLRSWRDAPAATEPAKSVARLLHSLKGSARMAGAMTLGGHLHQLESRLEDGLAERADIGALIDELAFGLDVTEQMISTLAADGAGVAAEPAPPVEAAAIDAARSLAGAPAAGPEAEAVSSATLRVRAELIDHFVNQAGEIGISRTRIDGELRTLRRSLLDLTENVIRLRNQLREVELQGEVQMQSRLALAESRHAEFDPLEMDRYTRLQELTRMMAESVNDVTTVQQSLLHNLDTADIALNGQARMARELQQGLMRVRMLPFDSLADRLYRVVRQSAKELGKRATLDLRGGRIEVDRSVLEQMAAPLEHLLRNAVAHGIESPAARRTAGKPEVGSIVLTLTQEGNEIAIELNDDGAGLDFDRIADRARANGLLAADETPDVRRLTNLIFLPGFSTAGALSAVSGRGVGMDVVKAQTAAVGGRIDVSSEQGRGTTFRIYLPLTLAVTQALLVRAGARSYAIPSSMVAQAMELKPEALQRVQAEHGIDWQGEHYAYRYLPRLLGDGDSQPEVQRYNWLLLLRGGAQTVALHVDGLRGNQEIVVKKAGPQLTRIVGMSGATVLGDGEIVLILNPVALASRGLGTPEADDDAVATSQAAPAPMHMPTVLVVDDSLTVRKITGRLLEREGYRVITAKDGVDALEHLLETVPDVVLSDIEMPRMDGFDLVRNIRADERTRHLPVIMITSRLADKHRRYAHEVGANHYLGKPYPEDELLALLAGYTGREQALAQTG